MGGLVNGYSGTTVVSGPENHRQQFRGHCVEPGFVATERQRQHWLTPQLEADVRKGQCLPDLIEPDAIADMVLFLASDNSRMCTSQTFIVDGGWT